MFKCGERAAQTHPIPLWSNATFLFLLTAAVAVFIAQHSTSDSRNVEITMGHSKALITVYMLYSIVFMVLSFRWRKNETFVTFERHSHQHSNEYLLVSVYVFGSGNFTKSIQEIFSFVHCKETTLDLTFTITYLVFVLLQIMFLQGFSEAHFKWNLWVHVSLFVVVASNATIWLFYLLEETNLFNDRDRDQRIHVHCIHSNKIAEALHHWKEYLLPFTLEYCIIVTGLIYNLASRMIHEQEAENMQQLSEDASPQTDEEGPDYRVTEDPEIQRNNENLEDENELTGAEKRKRKRVDILTKMRFRVKGSQPGLTAGIAVAVVMITSLVCVQIDGNDLVFFYSFIMVVNVSLGVGFVVLLKVSSSYKLLWYQFRIDDSLLMLTSFGVMVWSLLSVIAAGGNKEFPIEVRVLAILCSLTHAFAGVLQTATIIYMQRVYPEIKDAEYEEETIENGNATSIEMVNWSVNSPRMPLRKPAYSFTSSHVAGSLHDDHVFHSGLRKSRSNTYLNSASSIHGLQMLSVHNRMSRATSFASNNTIQSMISQHSCPGAALTDALTRARMDRAPESKFNQASMFTLIVNLGFWIMDSFFEIKNYGRYAYPMGESFFGERIWMFVVSITYPLCIFFRFHSAGMIYEMWAKFNGFVRFD